MSKTFKEDMISLYLWADRRAAGGLTKDQVNYVLREFKRAVEDKFPMEIARYKEETK
ncbi:hypothetical protein SMUDGE_58 [Bacillus phage Smudge]|uniref:Uncharacterized protein n=1 Tax=Bacillus phage Smudge TaxID=1852566 RepID=A0A173H2G6_9CAUD|nr:hypothetical protein SMUDGE_58 [Bacillus phage Smudge]ASR79275.1 hypothetical protein ZAINNY_62 [Bacillus phage Zainny]AUV57698.1 hypothetical protein HONESTABE_58 [Bacillus phage HonestAbe]ULF48972.1 hypothetical protein [Bacillus phage Darren]